MAGLKGGFQPRSVAPRETVQAHNGSVECWSGGLTGGISRRNKQIAVDLFVTFAGLHQLLLVYGFDIPGTRAKGWPLWLGFQAQMRHLGRGRDGPGLLSDRQPAAGRERLFGSPMTVTLGCKSLCRLEGIPSELQTHVVTLVPT